MANEFLIPEETEAVGFLTEEAVEPLPFKGSLSSKERREDLKAVTGLTDDEVEALSDANAAAFSTIAQRELAPFDSVSILGELIDADTTLEDLQARVDKKAQVEKALSEVEEFTNIDLALAKDPSVTATLFKIEHRKNRSRRILTDMAEEFEGGLVDKVLETIDIIGYDTWAGIRDVDTALSGEGTEISEISDQWLLAMRTMEDDEFDTFLQNRLSALQNSIASGSENSIRVIRELHALEAAGAVLWDEEMGLLAGTMSALDIATLGVTGASLGVKAGRSIVGRLRSTAGTTAATEAAVQTGVVRRSAGTDVAVRQGTNVTATPRPTQGLDGEILDSQLLLGGKVVTDKTPGRRKPRPRITVNVEDAEIIEDIAPGVMSSRVRPTVRTTRTTTARQSGGSTPPPPPPNIPTGGLQAAPTPPPVNQAQLSLRTRVNQFIRQALLREQRFSFGAGYQQERSLAWMTAEAQKLARRTSHNVIDTDLVEEGLQNYKASFTLGKEGGAPFNDYDSARNIANTLPNSSVVDLRTGATITGQVRDGQYAVKVEQRVPVKDTIDPLDLDNVKLKTFLGDLFGRASRGSSSYLSNLADAGDSGSNAFREDFKSLFKKLLKLPNNDVKVIDDILTTLRDSPTGGTARAWLRPQEFVRQFRLKTGELPSRETLKAYEDIVEMSDFSWFSKASERLSILANQKASVVRVINDDIMAFPTKLTGAGLKKKSGPRVKIWDADKQISIPVQSIPDEAILLELQHKVKVGGYNVDHVINFRGNTRVPSLEDAFPYNAGGPRSNPGINWFVGNNDGRWSTLIGARSEKDAIKATDEFNRVAIRLEQEFGKDPQKALDNFNTQPMPRALRQDLDNLVRDNRSWNPNLGDIEDWVIFANDRGLPINQKIIHRGRGDKVSEFIQTPDQSLVNLKLEDYVSYHRHDIALKEFGGSTVDNPNPISAIMQQFNASIDRVAQTQYRMEHPAAWVRAVERSKIDFSPSSLQPMTDEMKVKNWKINGNTKVAKKLRQEQSVINRRLDLLEGSQSATFLDPVGAGVERSAIWLSEVVHDNLGKSAGKKVRWFSDNFVTKGNNKLMSLGFFQNMASPDQLLLQSAHFIPVTAMSPENGFRGLTIATYIRQAARAGNASVWADLAPKLRVASGLDQAEFDILMKHMLDSGRGYMRGAIAEDPAAAGFKGSILQKVGKVLTIPYYAGENFGHTLSRVVAFLDTRKKFPNVDPNSKAFWNEVGKRDRDLSFGLNKAQKSMVQSDSALRVITQWTSYPLSTMEKVIFGGETLTGAERARLAFFSTLFWGVGGLGSTYLAGKVTEALGDNFVSSVIVDGADVFFEETLGISIGERIATNPFEIIDRAIKTVTLDPSAVPATGIVADTYDAAKDGFFNIVAGRYELGKYDIARLIRTWKAVDAPVMGYNMLMNDTRRSNSGQVIEKDFTNTQAFFQMIGINPTEAVVGWQANKLLRNPRQRRDRAIQDAQMPFTRAVEEWEKGNFDAAMRWSHDANAIIEAYGLSDTYRAEAFDTIFSRIGFDRTNWMLMEMVKNNHAENAEKIRRKLE